MDQLRLDWSEAPWAANAQMTHELFNTYLRHGGLNGELEMYNVLYCMSCIVRLTKQKRDGGN